MNQETFKNSVFHFKDKMYRFAKHILINEDEGTVRVNLMRARHKLKVQLQKIFDYEKRQMERYKG